MRSLKKKCLKFFKYLKANPEFIALFLIFLIGMFLRYRQIRFFNILFDYDQFEDLFQTKKIILGHLPIIGRPIYGNPNLHHGVFYFYFNLMPFVLFKQSPVFIVLWNNLFNMGIAILLYFFSKSIFQKKLPGLIAAFLWAISTEVIQFSSWISSTSVTLITVPIFFFGLWMYYRKCGWGILLAFVALGLSIQLELFFLYLVPVVLIYWAVLKPGLPGIKMAAFSILGFLITISTLILTEIKLHFAGVRTLLNFSQTFNDSFIPMGDRLKMFVSNLSLAFIRNILSTIPGYGEYLLLATILLVLIIYLVSPKIKKAEKEGIVFLLIYLFSPAIMLVWGYHKQPWFLIGISGAIVLILGYLLSKLNRYFIAVILSCVLIWGRNYQPIFTFEKSSLMLSQLQVVDYTYQSAGGKPFAINAVSYPLYHNALWEYHYNWYGFNKYGYFPGWLGGEQLFPYKTIPDSNGSEKTVFMIIDNTARIPKVYRLAGEKWAMNLGQIVETKEIGGFTVERININ
jgi:hypothetical protein